MLEAANAIIAFSADCDRDELTETNPVFFAVIKLIEIIGEAANGISDELRNDHPEIPWRDIVAARNRLIHGYFSIDRDIVWHTITTDIPPLITALDAIRDSE